MHKEGFAGNIQIFKKDVAEKKKSFSRKDLALETKKIKWRPRFVSATSRTGRVLGKIHSPLSRIEPG